MIVVDGPKIALIQSLDCRVLAVASLNADVGDWAAYIGAVAGVDHALEWREVKRHGSKLSREHAEAIFGAQVRALGEEREPTGGGFDGPYRWRD